MLGLGWKDLLLICGAASLLVLHFALRGFLGDLLSPWLIGSIAAGWLFGRVALYRIERMR